MGIHTGTYCRQPHIYTSSKNLQMLRCVLVCVMGLCVVDGFGGWGGGHGGWGGFFHEPKWFPAGNATDDSSCKTEASAATLYSGTPNSNATALDQIEVGADFSICKSIPNFKPFWYTAKTEESWKFVKGMVKKIWAPTFDLNTEPFVGK